MDDGHGEQAEHEKAELPPPGRVALIIAHPGHELAVHGWLERARPQVFLLTDGSGHSGVPRLQSTSKVLQGAGATPGSIFGRMPEQAVYRALLARDTGMFIGLAEELAEALILEGFDRVFGDMEEGFNPVHDTWRMVVNAAVAIVRRRTGRLWITMTFRCSAGRILCNGRVRRARAWSWSLRPS